ncbi:penicillin-binding protein [Aquirufa nivalisilvae]|uniref:Penicillin-binding protein 1A n=1 Tax=Aquirufa nivalisilvae TaxID=2516557 RepID=A0A2S2DSX0_9BACT|nr:transglycosylase domain-containing protein [Aquirufa nivalisilvae]AWL08399.1 Penicillin-binding protein 1A [Aquirufa nivalisilvae]MCZ2483605.1 penicillin-binding protein [Aquirufa nivalisilvae]
MFEFEEGKYLKLIRFTYKFLLGSTLFIVLFITAVNFNFLWLFGGMPSLYELENPKSQEASLLISEDGQEIGKYFRENRNPVEFEDLSPTIINTLMATEDARFTTHSGIDMRSMMRVVLSLGTSGGGSTISQQLAKNLFHTRSVEFGEDDPLYMGLLMKIGGLKTAIAKVKEWILAIKLERRYTKQEIMAMYLNEVSFGNNAYGIQVACRTYFQKDVKTVSLPEAATLIGLLQNPSLYDPRIRPEKTLERRNVVLGQLAKYDYVLEDEARTMMENPLNLKFKVENQNTGAAPYFRESIRKQILSVIKEINADRPEDQQINLYTSGLRIYTSIDSRMQKYAEESIQEHMKAEQSLFYSHWKGRNPWVNEEMKEIKGFLKDAMKRTDRYRELMAAYNNDEFKVWEELNRKVKMTVFSYQGDIDTTMSSMDSLNYYKRILNCGFMAMDPTNGHVKAWIGGINYKYFKFDHITQSKRQPGSTFKPFVYGAAIENEIATPCDELIDEPVTFGEEDGLTNGTWTPQNSDGKYSYEKLKLRRAMALSINTISAKLMKEMGPQKIAEFAHKAGISSPLYEGPSLCLGASEVSVYEQVSAYSTFANGGERIEPILILKITDKVGNVLREFSPTAKAAIKPETAYLMTYMLQGAVQEPGGTAEGLKRTSIVAGNEIGAKTGTTSNFSDGWFMGVTQKLVAGVWVGGDDRSIHFRSLALGQGAKMAMPAYAKFMEKVYSDQTLAIEGYRKMPFLKPEKFVFDFTCSGKVGIDSTAVPNTNVQ